MNTQLPVASGVANVPHMAALLMALDQLFQTIDVGTVLVQHPDFAPAAALPYLAQQYGVLGYKGFALCTTDDQRRAVVKNGIALNRELGTPASIENAIKALGYPDAVVTEQTGIRYDGTYRYDGSKRYDGTKWYNFDVEVFYTGSVPDQYTTNNITRLINICKPTRSNLFNLKFTQQV